MLIPAYWTVVGSTAGGGLTPADTPSSLAYTHSGLLTPSSGAELTALLLLVLELFCSLCPLSASDLAVKE